MMALLAPVATAFLVTTVLMLSLRRVAPFLGLVDVPGGRKTHHGEVPVIGGIAMYLGALVAVVLMGEGVSAEIEVLMAAGLMVAVGALDDRVDLRPRYRVAVHLAAAVTLVMATGFRVDSLGDLFGLGEVGLGPFDFPFTVLATVALINAFNMLDGVDGIAGGVALVALAGLSFHLVPAGNLAATITLALAGAVVGFLVFNLPARFNRKRLAFMGDAGSTLLGFALAGLALVAVQPRVGGGVPPALVLWMLPVPIVELFTSTIRRLVNGTSPMRADRGHFHHRLLDAGFSVRAVFLLYMVASSISVVTGLWLWHAGVSEAALFSVFLAVSVLWWVATHNARRLLALVPRSLRRGAWSQRRRREGAL
jgi:UDP-GlcNAc:undecaprenyl-phosphate GlcNAc-1-phosphate transferase